jgi:hypothetical protein
MTILNNLWHIRKDIIYPSNREVLFSSGPETVILDPEGKECSRVTLLWNKSQGQCKYTFVITNFIINQC